MPKNVMLVAADELVIGDVYPSGYVVEDIKDTPNGEALIVETRHPKRGRGDRETLKPESLHYIAKRDPHASHKGWHCFEDEAMCFPV